MRDRITRFTGFKKFGFDHESHESSQINLEVMHCFEVGLNGYKNPVNLVNLVHNK